MIPRANLCKALKYEAAVLNTLYVSHLLLSNISEVYTVLYFHHCRNGNVRRVNNLLKVTCSTVSRGAGAEKSDQISIPFFNPTLNHECLLLPVSKLCSEIWLQVQHISSMGQNHPKGSGNWILKGGEGNLTFNVQSTQMYK